jgi:hypothetical protein
MLGALEHGDPHDHQGLVFKHKARKPDFELTKPSTGRDYTLGVEKTELATLKLVKGSLLEQWRKFHER